MTEPRLKISVLLASRGNPEGLRTTIGTLDALASGKHDINYVVSADEDDYETQNAIPILYVYTQKRRPALGTAWNDAAKAVPADVYALVTDRSICVSPHWDSYIADAISKDDTRVLWWTTNAGPVIPIVPHKWLQASGQIFTDYFPFWFDDTWLHEVSAMVHGLPNYMVQASCFIAKKSPTTKRLRDLRFWMDFFIAKRPERVSEAGKIREALGVKTPDMRPIEEWFKANDEMWVQNWEKWEALMGDKSEPDESYLKAKKAAEDAIQRP